MTIHPVATRDHRGFVLQTVVAGRYFEGRRDTVEYKAAAAAGEGALYLVMRP